MLQVPQNYDAGDSTLALWLAHAQQEQYRTALGVIHHTASVAGQCPCSLLVAWVARQALTPPTTKTDYWRHCEA